MSTQVCPQGATRPGLRRRSCERTALAATKLADGSPLAVEIDTNFYFLCAVVEGHTAP
jgi:hypothetical protein